MSRVFLTGAVVGVEVPDAMVVIMVVNSESVFNGRNGNGIRWMWSTKPLTSESFAAGR